MYIIYIYIWYMNICIYIYNIIYIYICTCIYIYIHTIIYNIYIYICCYYNSCHFERGFGFVYFWNLRICFEFRRESPEWPPRWASSWRTRIWRWRPIRLHHLSPLQWVPRVRHTRAACQLYGKIWLWMMLIHLFSMINHEDSL